MSEKKISVKIQNMKNIEVPHNITAKELVDKYYQGKSKVLAVNVHNKLRTLDYEINKDCEIQFLTYHDSAGRAVYRRSLSFLLLRVIREMYRNGRLEIHHSLSNAYYYDLYIDIPLDDIIIDRIKSKMRDYIEKDLEFERREVTREEAIDIFTELGYPDKVALLKNVDVENIALYDFGPVTDINYGPLVLSTGYLDVFDVKLYHKGFRLCFPDAVDPVRITPMRYHAKLFQIHQESKKWSRILGITNIARLNQIIKSERMSDYIKINEVFHERKIAQISDMISKRDESRIVLIAGPSSSGKTTFSKRLRTHLQVNGLSPVTISLDDYFVNREDNPKDENGEYDFESIYSLDLELLNRHMVALLNGEEVIVPKFDFTKGRRKNEGSPLSINENQIIIIEGIHGLNDELTRAVPQKNKFKIYISALTQLTLDDYNRISTTDCRLIRRIVRDHQFRNYPA
ncbi:MAG: nucleoside kinase, partial [Candidatus Muiribacteriaceae bacterium]